MDEFQQLIVSHLPELTYERTDLVSITVEAEELARHCPLDNGRHDFTNNNMATTLGDLAVMPPEVLSMMLSALDLCSLTIFRAVNKCSRLHVDNLPQYKIIFAHAPSVLRAAIASGAGSWISCAQLANVLSNITCSRCADFGAFIYLLTWERVCFMCLSYSNDFLPLSANKAKTVYGLKKTSLNDLHTLTTIPGTYSHSLLVRKKRIRLVDPLAAFEAGIRQHSSVESMTTFFDQRCSALAMYRRRTSFYASDTLPVQDPRQAAPPQSDGHASNALRFQATVRAPYIDIRNDCTDWGVSCAPCRDCGSGQRTGRRNSDWRRLFTRATYTDHARSCPHAEEALKVIAAESTEAWNRQVYLRSGIADTQI